MWTAVPSSLQDPSSPQELARHLGEHSRFGVLAITGAGHAWLVRQPAERQPHGWTVPIKSTDGQGDILDSINALCVETFGVPPRRVVPASGRSSRAHPVFGLNDCALFIAWIPLVDLPAPPPEVALGRFGAATALPIMRICHGFAEPQGVVPYLDALRVVQKVRARAFGRLEIEASGHGTEWRLAVLPKVVMDVNWQENGQFQPIDRLREWQQFLEGFLPDRRSRIPVHVGTENGNLFQLGLFEPDSAEHGFYSRFGATCIAGYSGKKERGPGVDHLDRLIEQSAIGGPPQVGVLKSKPRYTDTRFSPGSLSYDWSPEFPWPLQMTRQQQAAIDRVDAGPRRGEDPVNAVRLAMECRDENMYKLEIRDLSGIREPEFVSAVKRMIANGEVEKTGKAREVKYRLIRTSSS